MALDGAFLRHVKEELRAALLGARVDKIYQPNSEEFVFSLRSKSGAYKLLLSARANSARVHLTEATPENPATPPMLCMLFRKKLLSAKLIDVRQPDLERVLFFDFDARNELGDEVLLTLAAEMMGKHSNVILLDDQQKIIDALKRIDLAKSSKRQVLPGLNYSLPPAQGKLSLLDDDIEEIVRKVEETVSTQGLVDALLQNVMGLSSVVCNEVSKKSQVAGLRESLEALKSTVKICSGAPFITYDGDRPKDFSFLEPNKLEDISVAKKCESFSALLDEFFEQRDSIDRMRVKSHDLRKQIGNILARLRKKLKIQAREVENNKNKDNLKLFADLINANLYRIKPGETEVELGNFYDKNQGLVRIKLDATKTAAENAQNFYRQYKKSKVAVEKLTEEMDKATQEIAYLESVLDAVERAEAERDLIEIKNELVAQGFIRLRGAGKKKLKALPPIEYTLDGGAKVLVGRNNHQNDQLTLKMAAKKDIWFHVKDMPGSHTILVANSQPVEDETLLLAAKIAAYHSKAKNSANVPVDFALVKDVKKPAGARPGMVIYNNYKTLYVTPDKNLGVL